MKEETSKKNNQQEKNKNNVEKNNKNPQKNNDKNLLIKIKKLERELTKTKEENENLLIEVNKLTIEKQKEIQEFHNKAQGFSKKAQEEINKFKKEHSEKKEKELKNAKKYSLQKLFESIIDPLNNIHIAITSGKSQGEAIKAYVQGFEMLLNQLFGELENFGLKIIEPKVGQEYDHVIHKAISTEKGTPNKIIKVIKRGFIFNDRVIDPATVIIGK